MDWLSEEINIGSLIVTGMMRMTKVLIQIQNYKGKEKEGKLTMQEKGMDCIQRLKLWL